ncbi:MAG TPA: hypothetical protein ENK38_00725 [Gammaproteobacteria bacterium]|nr:hypothetical protein [Gammaproteobacteria bacterium]
MRLQHYDIIIRLLAPFDRKMRRKGYRLTRFADDWLVTCRTRAGAQAVLNFAKRVLDKLEWY